LTHQQSIDDSSPAGELADIEEHLATIYAELLHAASVGPEDDFFLLGGNSLLATRLTEQVEARMGVRIPPRSFYANPSVGGLSRVIAGLQAAAGADPTAGG
jgi:hypothetical protein